MAQALSGSQLYHNNEIVEYMPNSLKYELGTPERKVDPQVVGNSSVVNVISEDYATAKAMISFDLKTTTENEAKLQTMIDNFDNNVFKIVSNDGVTRVFQNAVVINKPEIDTGADGVISIEIESSQAAIG